jgi:hypothetical protein
VLGDDPDWFRGMCRRYRAAQKKITGVAYQGDPFPKSFPLLLADEDDLFDIDDMLQRLEFVDVNFLKNGKVRQPARGLFF